MVNLKHCNVALIFIVLLLGIFFGAGVKILRMLFYDPLVDFSVKIGVAGIFIALLLFCLSFFWQIYMVFRRLD